MELQDFINWTKEMKPNSLVLIAKEGMNVDDPDLAGICSRYFEAYIAIESRIHPSQIKRFNEYREKLKPMRGQLMYQLRRAGAKLINVELIN